MSGAPFRDLFAEIPAALFDALKGMGEAAIVDAQRREAAYVKRGSTFWYVNDHDGYLARTLCEMFGWKNVEISRAAASATIEIAARYHCRHVKRIELPEAALVEYHVALMDALMDALYEAHDQGRPCCCIPREHHEARP